MLREEANANVFYLMGGGPGGTFNQIASNIADLLDDASGDGLRVTALTGRGSQQALEDAIFLDTADAVMMSPHVRDFYESNNFLPSVDLSRLQYIMTLFPEETHVIAREGIDSIEDLEGRRVAAGNSTSGTFVTATLLLRDYGVQADVVNMSNGAGLDAVLAGEVDAVFRETGAPNSAYTAIPEDSGLHFLPIDTSRLNTPSYTATVFTHDDYPTLIPEGTEIPTMFSTAALATYVPEGGNPRKDVIDQFVELLLTNFDTFQASETYHPKWQEMDPTLEIGGWTRYEAAAQYLAR